MTDRLITALLCLMTHFAFGGIVPFSGDLRPEMVETFQALEQTSLTDSGESLHHAFQLYMSSDNSPDPVRAWALATYVDVLLEHDSISRAGSLLLDSGLVNWNGSDDWLKAYHSLELAKLWGYQGKYASAFDLLSRVQGSTQGLLNLHILQELSENLRYQGKLEQSLVLWYEALKVSELLADSAEIMDCYGGQGVVRFLQGELDRAEKDFTLYLLYNTRIGNKKKQAYALSLLGLVDYKKGAYGECIGKTLESYNMRKALNDLKGQGESLNNLALGYMGLKNWNQALRYLEDAFQLKAQANDLTQMTVILNNMGHCHRMLGNLEEALHDFKLALEKGRQNGQMRDVEISYSNIMNLHVSRKEYEKAFDAQHRLMKLKDSLAQAERVEAIHELEVKYETEKKEQEIALLQQQQTLITNRWLTLALGLFLAIVIGVLVLDNQKRKHRQERELLSREDELQKAELKIMTDLLEHNQQKLALYTENLIRKNQLVSQLEGRLKEAVESSSGGTKDANDLKVNFSSVRILTDQDWEEFKELFDGAHHGLREKLLTDYGNLTLGEQRLFLLMKLDMSTKQIANILGVSPDSVKKARYRLKKKLQLADDVLLIDFIKGF